MFMLYDALMAFVALLGGYIASSLFFFKFPLLLHKKKQLKFQCCHISHRGGAAENLENTIAAFEHAVTTGTDMLELDVHLTKDGEVVVSHDDNLLRSTGVDKNISDLNYLDIPPLKAQLPVDFDNANLCKGGSDRKIPLLRHVFQQFAMIPINVDIKSNNDDLITKVSQLTHEFKREELTVWGNFQDQVTRKCYTENPQMPILFSSKRVLHLCLLAYSGLLPFVNIRESCLEIFLPAAIEKNTNSMFHQNKSYRMLVWLMDKLLMRRSLFNHLKKRGIQTYLWVLNEEAEFDKAFSLGVTGIMTDYPTRLAAYLEKNPHIQNCRHK